MQVLKSTTIPLGHIYYDLWLTDAPPTDSGLTDQDGDFFVVFFCEYEDDDGQWQEPIFEEGYDTREEAEEYFDGINDDPSGALDHWLSNHDDDMPIHYLV